MCFAEMDAIFKVRGSLRWAYFQGHRKNSEPPILWTFMVIYGHLGVPNVHKCPSTDIWRGLNVHECPLTDIIISLFDGAIYGGAISIRKVPAHRLGLPIIERCAPPLTAGVRLTSFFFASLKK